MMPDGSRVQGTAVGPLQGRVPELGRTVRANAGRVGGVVLGLLLLFVFAGSGVAAGETTPVDGVDRAGVSVADADGNLSTQASFGVDILDVTAPVEGEPVVVTVEVTNAGAAGEQVVVADAGPLGEANQTVNLGAGASTQVELTVETEIRDAEDAPYTLTVASADSAVSTAVDVTLPPVGSANGPPRDPNGDDRYEDINRDGVFTIFDVQGFFISFGDSSVQTHSWAFNFDGSADGAVTIFDVQSLFLDLASGSVEPRAPFAVSLTDVDTDVPVGETFSVGYEVENTGVRADTQALTFGVGGSIEETRSVTLAPGETASGTFVSEAGPDDVPGVGVSVASGTDSAVETVLVSDSAAFGVNITGADSEVTAGESLAVDYEVTNTGGIEGSQTVEFAVNGSVEETTTVTLGGGETFDGTFAYGTGAGDVPAVALSVSSANDTATATVGVLEPAEFAVGITGANTPVEGEGLTVNASVENVGEVEATQTVSLDTGPLGSTSTSVTLGGGASTNLTLSVSTDAGDAGEYTATVSSSDDSATETVTVLAPAEFAVSVTDIKGSVLAGESLTAEYEVTNTGDVEATQTVEFAVNGTTEDTQSVTLGGGETSAGNFSYQTGVGDVPAVNVSVASADDTVTGTVTVLAPAEFAVAITDVEDPVIAGAELTVDYEVTNEGDAEATQTVGFSVNGTTEGTTNVTLAGGETFTGTFAYATGAGDIPQVTVAVSSADDTDTATANVSQGDILAVTADVPDEAVAGESVTVAYSAENTGTDSVTQDITFSVDGTVQNTTNVTVAGGATFNGTFSYETGSADVPELSLEVASEDDAATRTVAVLSPAEFVVNITDAPADVAAGENLTASYEVTNAGDAAATQTVEFSVNGTVENTTTVTLDGGETFTSAFTYPTGSADIPAVAAAVSTADDTDSQAVGVLEPAEFVVNITALEEAVVAGETVTAEYEVENTGGAGATRNVTFAVNGTTEGTAAVTLDGGETVAGNFSYQTGSADAPAVAVTVSTPDDSATGTVTVSEPAFLDVTLTAVEEAVVAGETVTAEYEVTNTGDIEATQTVEFTVNGSAENTTTVTLGGGETATGAFSYDTSEVDTPGIEVAVSSANDTATEAVTVLSPAAFAVTLTAVDQEVVEGDTVTVEYEVTNTGDIEATQTVEFTVDGGVENTTTVTLGGGDTSTGAFSYQTGSGDAPGVDIAVSSANDTATETVTVLEPAAFAVTITDAPTDVVAGETVSVDYEVTNTGDAADTQAVEFTVDGSVENTTTVTLGGGESSTGAFSYDTGETDTPGIEVAVSSADDTATQSVTVNEAAFLVVSLTSVTGEVTAGETVTVDYEVENTGGVEGTQEITLSVNGSVENTTTATLTGGETFAGAFSYDTTDGDAPGIEVGVSSANDSASATVTVNEPAFFDVTIDGFDSEVTEGESVTVNYTVENTGDLNAVQDIEFTVNGTTETTRSDLALSGGANTTGTFTYDTAIGDSPALTLAVASVDDQDTVTTTVLASDPDIIATLSNEVGAVGDTVNVSLNLTSFGSDGGDGFGSYGVGFSYDDSILNFTGIGQYAFSNGPAAINVDNNSIGITDISLNSDQIQTPLEPALTLGFEVLSDGTSPVVFDSEPLNGDNQFNNGTGDTYQTKYEDGSAGTSTTGTVSSRLTPAPETAPDGPLGRVD